MIYDKFLREIFTGLDCEACSRNTLIQLIR